MAPSSLSLLVGLAAFTSAVPQPLAEIDASKYFGRWFQVYASFNVKYTFELGGNCVTADYGATKVPGTVSVLNTVRLFPFFRRFLPSVFSGVKITGHAAQSPDIGGALSVILGPFASDPTSATFSSPGNYWIIELGPVVDGLYDYALVSDSEQASLYVLTRDTERFKATYEEGVLSRLEGAGFTGFFNKPLATNQEGCSYELD